MSVLELRQFDHVGIRVAEADRAVAFYESLGFAVVARHETARVIIMRSQRGMEINLVVNARPIVPAHNVLMEEAVKHAGYTHVAFRVDNLAESLAEVRRLGYFITEGPVELGDGVSFFIRDPDHNVIELRALEP